MLKSTSTPTAVGHPFSFSQSQGSSTGDAPLPSKNFGEKWTPELDAELKQLHRAGYSNKDIAQKMGRTPGGISSRLTLIGEVEVKYADPNRYKKPDYASSSSRDNNFELWTPALDDQLRRDFKRGRPARDIALDMGRTQRAINIRLTKLGLQSVKYY